MTQEQHDKPGVCRHPLATRPILYTDTLRGEQTFRDDLWAVTTEELNALLTVPELQQSSPKPTGEPLAWAVPQRPHSEYDMLIYPEKEGAEMDVDSDAEDEEQREIIPLYPASAFALSARPLTTDREYKALEGLVQVASAAYNALDNSEDCDDSILLGKVEYDQLADALEVLNGLPDDQPGFTMCPSAKAAWSLNRLLDEDSPSVAASTITERSEP